MATEKSPNLKVKRRKLKKTKSLKEKLFSIHIGNAPKPKLKSDSKANSLNGTPFKKSSCETMQVPTHPKHASTGSKLSIFIHETFDKLSNPSGARKHRSVSTPNMRINDMQLSATDSGPHLTPKFAPKSYWRPSLHAIYNDHALLSALTAFMERSYNSELILFLHAVHQINTKIDSINTDIAMEQKSNDIEINEEIHHIYRLYLSPAADYQVNVSSECFFNASRMCNPQFLSSCEMKQKRKIFDQPVKEVEYLMINSVLSLFYDSHEFQAIAQKQSPSVSPLSKPATVPIVLSLSQCTLSVEAPAVVGTMSDDANDDPDEFENDEIIYLDQDYFQTMSENV